MQNTTSIHIDLTRNTLKRLRRLRKITKQRRQKNRRYVNSFRVLVITACLYTIIVGSLAVLTINSIELHGFVIYASFQCQQVVLESCSGFYSSKPSSFSNPQEVKARKTVTDNRLIDWIVLTQQPFSVVSSEPFIDMMKACSSGTYKPPCRQTVRDRVTHKRDVMDNTVKDYLKQVRNVGMLTDTWTADYQNMNYCGWIAVSPNILPSSDALLDYFALGMPRTPYDHDADGLKKSLQEMTVKFDLQGKISGITTDSASLNPSAFDQLSDSMWYA